MSTYEIQTRDHDERTTAVSRATLAASEVGPWLQQTLGAVFSAVTAQGRQVTGPPFSRYHMRADGRFEVEAGFPVDGAVADAGEVAASSLPAGPVATTVHVGPYEALQPAYVALHQWVTAEGKAPAGDPWEVYLTSPAENPDPSTWRTEVLQPYR